MVVVTSLTALERRRILHEWNDTRSEFPDVCVHELFEQVVARTPDAPAVVWRGQEITYAELNGRANQVANLLRGRGVGPEVLVGVALERTPDLVVALLGVWKAGGAYVPLDPSYPQQRLSFMVEDANVRVLLTAVRCRHLFQSA
jgi:non-ribosomal peptide synthetase component F